jgi:hypothetical protein
VAGVDRSDELFVECARLVAENATLTAENARLSAENVELRSLVERIEARIAELEHRQGRMSRRLRTVWLGPARLSMLPAQPLVAARNKLKAPVTTLRP